MLLCEVRMVLTGIYHKDSTHVVVVKEINGDRNLGFCAVVHDFNFRIVLQTINRTDDSLNVVVRSTSCEDVYAIPV